MSESEDKPTYTVDLNGKRYEMNEDWRASIQRRAELEYEQNKYVECFWKVASQEDAENSDIHEVGDPILCIETEGPMVPWERLDQLELEMQDTSAYEEYDTGSGSDVDEGNGMRTIKPGEAGLDQNSDEDQEISRTHFDITPQQFEEVPSPDGERPDRVPPKPQKFDEPTLVAWVPEHPEITHSWSAGEAITPMYNWVEWNVQAKADQPRITQDKPNSHDHFESLARSHDCEVVGELKPKQQPKKSDGVTEVPEDAPDHFKNGKYGGGHWSV